MKKFLKNEKGSVLILVAIGMVVFMGFAAFSIDIGHAYLTKSKLQNAADAAALAGAEMLPNYTNASSMAIDYAKKNGVQASDITVIVPYEDHTKVKVICKQNVDYTFARALGLASGTVTASAVAQNGSQWDSEALPFLNLGCDYMSDPIISWTWQAPGDMGTIMDFNTILQPSLYFEIDYTDGITITEGFAGGTKGLDHSTLKTGVDQILDSANPGDTFYIFSLSEDAIHRLLSGAAVQVTDQNGKLKDRYFGAGGGFKNGDTINPLDLVLLEVQYQSSDLSNHHDIELKYVDEYTLTGTDFPTGTSTSGVVKLVE